MKPKNEMFELINLQQHFRDPYNEEENDQRNNCKTKDSSESKTDNCKSFKKYEKYKKMNETTNKIKEFKYEENIVCYHLIIQFAVSSARTLFGCCHHDYVLFRVTGLNTLIY
jgi:hypothetical protein